MLNSASARANSIRATHLLCYLLVRRQSRGSGSLEAQRQTELLEETHVRVQFSFFHFILRVKYFSLTQRLGRAGFFIAVGVR